MKKVLVTAAMTLLLSQSTFAKNQESPGFEGTLPGQQMEELPLPQAVPLQKGRDYTEYVLEITGATQVIASTVFETKDNCNKFTLTSGLRKIGPLKGVTHFEQELVLVADIHWTELPCRPGSVRHIPMSYKFEIKPDSGNYQRVRILVPSEFTLKIK